MDCSTPGFLVHHQLMSIELMSSNHLILCCPLLLPPSVFPSIRVFSNESVLRIRYPKHWSFSFSPSSEYSGLISFRTDWFDLAVQGTIKSLLLHHSSKASILQHLAFFNMLSRFVIVFLPKSNRLLISWLQSLSAVILEPKESLSLFPLFPHLFAMK